MWQMQAGNGESVLSEWMGEGIVDVWRTWKPKNGEDGQPMPGDGQQDQTQLPRSDW